jgi:hypothetical protein
MALPIIAGRRSQFYGVAAIAAVVHHHMPLGLTSSINIKTHIF